MNVVVIPCLYDNYSYLIVNEDQAAVVDPAEAWPVMQEIDKRNLKLTAALCTHHHHDHVGGLPDLLDEYQDLAVFGYYEDRNRIPLITHSVKDGDRISVCGLEAKVLHTPGHTSTHVVFILEDHLFVGDTLFGGGCGRLFEGTPAQMVHSLDKISACPASSKIYFGHEYTELNLRFAAQVDSTNTAITERAGVVAQLRSQGKPSAPSMLAEELATNPFLRAEDASIIEKLQADSRLAGTERVEVFAALRELRNHFS